jgi:hypothetical protein
MSAAEWAQIADLPSFGALRSQFLGLLTSAGGAFRPRPRRQGQEGPRPPGPAFSASVTSSSGG